MSKKCVSHRACPEPRNEQNWSISSVLVRLQYDKLNWGVNQPLKQSTCEKGLLSLCSASTKDKCFIHVKESRDKLFSFCATEVAGQDTCIMLIWFGVAFAMSLRLSLEKSKKD